MKLLKLTALLSIVCTILNGCALHRGGNFHDYINDKIYFYGSYNKPLGWGELTYDSLGIGRFLSTGKDVKFSLKLKDGRILRISYNNTTEDYIKNFAIKVEQNQEFSKDHGRYAIDEDGYVRLRGLGDDIYEIIYKNVTDYTIVNENPPYQNITDFICFSFYDGKILYINIFCNEEREKSNFLMGRYDENKFFKMPLTQEQVEYIFGKPEFYRIYWY